MTYDKPLTIITSKKIDPRTNEIATLAKISGHITYPSGEGQNIKMELFAEAYEFWLSEIQQKQVELIIQEE